MLDVAELILRNPDTTSNVVVLESTLARGADPFLLRESKTFLARPLSCVLSPARERHLGALWWLV